MNTLHLKYAVEIERSGSITRAAEKLYMNQPHLSKTIHELEESVGIQIFKRTSKGMVPTKKGREFLDYAKNILYQLEKMENLLRGEDERKLSLSIAVPRASYVSDAFVEFVAALPADRDLYIDYRETNSLRSIREVGDGEIDLGIIRFQAEYESYFMEVMKNRNIHCELVRSFRYYLLMSRKHPLAARKNIQESNLDGFIEIMHGDAGGPTLPISSKDRALAGAGKTIREIAIYERGSQLELLDRVPETYMWVSPMPRYILDKFSLVQRRCDILNNEHKDYLIYRKGHRFTNEERVFVEKLTQAASGTAEE